MPLTSKGSTHTHLNMDTHPYTVTCIQESYTHKRTHGHTDTHTNTHAYKDISAHKNKYAFTNTT